MTKKSNILDFFYIIVILFMIAVVLVVSYIVIDTADQTELFDDVAVAKSSVTSAKNTILNMDNLMLFVIIGLSVAVLVSSFIVYHHPAFMIISAILLMIAVVVAAIASNTIWTFFNQATIKAAADSFPKLTFLFDKLPIYIAFMGLITLVGMFISYQKQ